MGVKRVSILNWSRSQLWKAAALVAAGGAALGMWNGTRPRTITVFVGTDYSFRQQRPNWHDLLDIRFAEVNRIFSGTGVQWSFRHAGQPDPTARIHGMETRRQKLIRAECEADVILGVTGQPESKATGDVPAFAHTAIVVDSPSDPETRNQ